MNNKLQHLKNEYVNIAIPKDFDLMVRRTVYCARKSNKHGFLPIKVAAAVILAIFVVTTVGINTSTVLAASLSKVPVIGGIIKVLTFRSYTIDEGTYHINVQAPAVSGLTNAGLQSALNEKYLEENKNLYEQFVKDMEELKKNGGGSLGIKSGYEVVTETDRILSIGRYVVNTVGSSSTTFKYDSMDKIDGILITLPSLFKDDSYINIISDSIKRQMVEQYNSNNKKFYWVEGIPQNTGVEYFNEISKDQNFYINKDGKLVISFDKYKIGPGSTGTPQFIIPTDILSSILVSNVYIK